MSVLCRLGGASLSPYTEQGFGWLPRPPAQAPGEAVPSGDVILQENHEWVFCFQECLSRGSLSSAACVGSHASLLLEQPKLMLFLAAYAELDCFRSGLWLCISASALQDFQSGQPLGHSVLRDVCL